MAGEIDNPSRPRYEANERFDTVDADASSRAPREGDNASMRAVTASPRAAGGSVPTGLIIQGFGLTLNPSGPSDGLVRVQAAVGVALDADGGLLIKEDGTSADLTIPSGNNQIYAYFVELSTELASRRFITVATPFTEYPKAIYTALQGSVAFYVRAGDQTTILASDVVNGRTVPLAFLGIVTNTGGLGTITSAGYDATTAPNGGYATNRVTSPMAAPSTPPTTSTMSGSITSIVDAVQAILYYLGRAKFKGSLLLTPAAANNFGAFDDPDIGLQGLVEDVAAERVQLHDRMLEWVMLGPAAANDQPDQIMDYEFSGLANDAFYGSFEIASTQFAYVPHAGQAIPYQSPTALNIIRIGAGRMYQARTRVSADAPQFLWWYFDGTDEFAISSNVSGNPRVDIIQMRLTWNPTTRRVDREINVKQGATAASPAYPTPDGGYVMICGVVVLAGYAGATAFSPEDSATLAVIHDQRMPMGKPRVVTIRPKDFFLNSNWTAGQSSVTCSGAGGSVYAIPQEGGKTARILGVYLWHIKAGNPGGTGIFLAKYKQDAGSGINITTLNNVSSSLDNTSAGVLRRSVIREVFEAQHLPAVGPTVQVGGLYLAGPPIWTNGKRSPMDRDMSDPTVDAADYFENAILWITSGSTSDAVIWQAQFILAEGL